MEGGWLALTDSKDTESTFGSLFGQAGVQTCALHTFFHIQEQTKGAADALQCSQSLQNHSAFIYFSLRSWFLLSASVSARVMCALVNRFICNLLLSAFLWCAATEFDVCVCARYTLCLSVFRSRRMVERYSLQSLQSYEFISSSFSPSFHLICASAKEFIKNLSPTYTNATPRLHVFSLLLRILFFFLNL